MRCRYLFLLLLLFQLTAAAQKAPDFRITDTEGREWNLYSELAKGKTVVLDFFFADCIPCQTFTPQVEQLYQDYGTDTGKVVVLGISDRDTDERVKEFEALYGVSYPTAGMEGGGDTVTTLYASYFPFVGWPVYAVVCPDSSINWNIRKEKGLPDVRATINHCPETPASLLVGGAVYPEIEVYPIPASDRLILQHVPAGQTQITLYDLTGRVAFEAILFSNIASPIPVSLPELPSGTYCLKITSAGIVSVKKVLIQTP